jgi:hypothetical protein
MQVRLRYNSKHRDGQKPWKLTIDDSTLLVENVKINCPTYSIQEDIPTVGVKFQIACDAQRITIENGTVIVE